MRFVGKVKKTNPLLWIILFASIACIVFICFGLWGQEIGFPLDDAWIHQTYAKNLVTFGSWTYSSGMVSGGSTSPLWTLLISLGYLISNNFGILWTFVISVMAFLLLVSFSSLTFRNEGDQTQIWKVFFFGLLLASEWHLLWSTGSGMETTLYSLAIVFLMYLLFKVQQNWLWIGITAGLLVWLRPDGITLLGPIAFIFVLQFTRKQSSLKELFSFLGPYIFFGAGYILFNLLTTGNILPNTFYAKQIEYQELLNAPIFNRILTEISPVMTGAGLLVLPGFLFEIWQSIRTKNTKYFAIILWILGFILLYSFRLPVVYQHGRYIVPVIAPYFILGCIGIFSLLSQIKNIKFGKLLSVTWIGSIAIIAVGFYFIGMNTYRSDVEIINQLLVQPAKWVNDNLSQDDIIAVHDIGAMGYFSNRKLIDLAGLINPEVIPIMNDQNKIFQFMKTSDADYFVGFQDWYSNSSTWGTPIKLFTGIYQNTEETVVVLKLK